MAVARRLARFNKRYANKVMRLVAPYVPPLALIVHKGRTSGAEYRTPVNAYRFGDQVAVVLYYGETDWVRNVLAAGEADLTRLGRTVHIANPTLVDSRDEALGSVLHVVSLRAKQVMLADVTGRR
ncbi:deazaflavin-dependent oxidoreductase (nitroreductase family) [Herbihabitans rhizosphaerae]|uniref:Deazaflavin-dependent oxidoreductase (Nitroreductase family) n=1 Tax=Herbihabitans rhizosphaerae TaxID=1872711 RepID=A0A4Q7KIR8_9PSEU|nr:nitroreductase family deazaflavin-dependent oxidoreductase [Herbihabitans rhizosphaerae]RZS34831.1 deazaflavin-dependent oxidoreductase (nitroreductase family) [Herbihabitans rhizosphaerae]